MLDLKMVCIYLFTISFQNTKKICQANSMFNSMFDVIVHFKHLGSRNIHKEIEIS